MGCGEEVGARRQAAEIERDCEIGVISLNICDCCAGRFT